jgi:hypothetical protein
MGSGWSDFFRSKNDDGEYLQALKLGLASHETFA